MFRVKFDVEHKIWKSCDTQLVYNPKISLGHILLKSMELNKPKIAQISDDTGERLTYEELRMKTIRAAQNLGNRGYESKQVIGIMAGNVPNLAPIVIASLCLGCPISAADGTVEKLSIFRIIRQTKPIIIFCEVQFYDLIFECINELEEEVKIFTLNGTKGDSEPVENLFHKIGTEEDFIPSEIDGINEPAFIMNTSGSTGPSKGAALSHAAIISEINATNVLYANEMTFTSFSLYWNCGLFSFLLSTTSGATRIITSKPFSPEILLRIVEDYKVTLVEELTCNLVAILKSGLMPKTNLSSLKHVFVGGFKVARSVLEEFNSCLPNGSVHNAYGLTEIGYNVSIDFPDFSGTDTVGRIVNGFTVKIVDEHGNRCGVNVCGEICIKSRYKFLGYHQNEKLTDIAMDSEGFFLTGDLGHIDQNGYLYIAERKKNVIAYHLDWVFPSEIESVLLKCSDIKGVCVVGVPQDEYCDSTCEYPAAVIVRSKGSEITEHDICQIVEDNLVDHCKLRGGVYFINSIPTSSTGKPLPRLVKEIARKLYSHRLLSTSS